MAGSILCLANIFFHSWITLSGQVSSCILSFFDILPRNACYSKIFQDHSEINKLNLPVLAKKNRVCLFEASSEKSGMTELEKTVLMWFDLWALCFLGDLMFLFCFFSLFFHFLFEFWICEWRCLYLLYQFSSQFFVKFDKRFSSVVYVFEHIYRNFTERLY